MPEGHTIHRIARIHAGLLSGRVVTASSPQGRFSAGARQLDGGMLCTVEAHGKHLFYRFGPGSRRLPLVHGRLTLHVHLGLFGRFREHQGDAPPPTAGTRLVLGSGDLEVRLSGPTACELIDPLVEDALRSRLGPDPLRADDPSPALAKLRRRRSGVGQALLDQRVVAGVGNVYRAEVLFLAGIHPDRPAHTVDGPVFDRLWILLRRLMVDGERRGQIITVQPQDRRVVPARLRQNERLYVYGRAGLPCRRCGTTIVSWELGGRMISACPTCQPA